MRTPEILPSCRLSVRIDYLRDQFNAGVSANGQAACIDGAEVTVPGFADRIKALNAAQSIVPTPLAPCQFHFSDEEPAPSRSCRVASGDLCRPCLQTQDSSIKPQMMFQEHIAPEK